MPILTMPTVTFSLKTSQWEALESASSPGESQNLAAKRIFLNALGDDAPAQPPAPDALEELNQRLDKLESELKSLALQFSERGYELSQQVSEIERRLDSFPAAPPSPTRLPAATRRGA